ncbi:MAG: ABC transporter substrate-binding protein [Candidatus Cloacimonetes bacterium]|nr:ABC transporter substrate-binding protein [Candidatus Cloacimonadota bacterium]
MSDDSTSVGENATFTIRYRPQWSHQAQFAGVYMAAKKGFYHNYGLNVEILPGGPEYPAYESIQNGSTDVSQLFLLTALARDAELNNLVNLAQISQKSSLMLVGKRARGINSIADLNHKDIGLWRTDFRELSLIFLKQNKLNMNIINVDLSIGMFLNDVLDLMNVMRYNEYHQIIQAGIDPDELFLIPFSDVGLNILEDGLYATRDFYDRYPTQCKNFAEATMDGWIYAINHQEETIDLVLDIMRRHYIRANRPHQAWMLKEMSDVVLAKPNRVGELHITDFDMAKNLLSQQGIPVSKQSYQEFYPNAK